MNRYEVTIYYKLFVYNGWSSKYPYRQIIDKHYYVESDKSIEGLKSHILFNMTDLYLQIHITESYDLIKKYISEKEIIDEIRSAHIGIFTNELLPAEHDSTLHRQFGWDEQQESDYLFQKSVQVGEATRFQYAESEVVILKGSIYGVISKGKCVVPFGKYDWIEPFGNGLSRVILNQKWGIINTSGVVVLPLEYDHIRRVKNGLEYSCFECHKDAKKSVMSISSM